MLSRAGLVTATVISLMEHTMKIISNTLFTYIAVLVIAGCQPPRSTQVIQQTASEQTSPQQNPSADSNKGMPIFIPDETLLDMATVTIRLDVHQGITWYNQERKAWETIESIDSIRDLLEGTPEKSVISIRTGKATWDKEDEYIQCIAEFAKTLNFEAIVVTTDHSSAIVISKVIRLKD